MSRAHTGVVNHYHCDECDVSWQDEWCCECDDECPECGADITPHESEHVAACTHPECIALAEAVDDKDPDFGPNPPPYGEQDRW